MYVACVCSPRPARACQTSPCSSARNTVAAPERCPVPLTVCPSACSRVAARHAMPCVGPSGARCPCCIALHCVGSVLCAEVKPVAPYPPLPTAPPRQPHCGTGPLPVPRLRRVPSCLCLCPFASVHRFPRARIEITNACSCHLDRMSFKTIERWCFLKHLLTLIGIHYH